MNDRPYRRLSPLTPLARSGIFVLAVLTATWRDLIRGDIGPFGLMLLGLLIAGGIYGGISWLRTKYWIEEDELRVDTGVIAHQSRRIRIDRLQGVDIRQPFVARLFGLAELRMDVAGGSAREGSLAFLTLSDARELKDVLLARRDAVKSGATPESADEVAARPAEPDRLLARVDLSMLVLSTLLSPESIFLVLATIVYGGLILVMGEAGGFAVWLPIVGGLGLVLARRISGSYNFTVAQTSAGLQVRRGLFELTAQTIALARLQGVTLSEPLLWRKLHWVRLDVSIAGYGEASNDEGPSASTVLPVGERPLAMWLSQYMLGGSDFDRTSLTGPPKRARWVSPVGRRFMSAGSDESLVVSREGWFVRRTHVVPHARVQSLRLTQGPVQRLLGLADLHVDSPPGPVKVRARDRLADEARGFLEEEVIASRNARKSLQESVKPGDSSSQGTASVPLGADRADRGLGADDVEDAARNSADDSSDRRW